MTDTPTNTAMEFVLVPREATEAMLDAADVVPSAHPGSPAAWVNEEEAAMIWTAMLAAAPVAPTLIEAATAEQGAVGREEIARWFYDREPACGWRTVKGKPSNYAIPWGDATEQQREEAICNADAIIALRPSASAGGVEDAQAETYREMHEIATKELGYPSILEALEACPKAGASGRGGVDGWKLVPVEPTPEMESAGTIQAAACWKDRVSCTGKHVWAAMLRKAPAAPSSPAATPEVESAWRDGWTECKNRVADDEAFCLTEDVEEDAWLDSTTRAALSVVPEVAK